MFRSMEPPSITLCAAVMFALLSCGDQRAATAQPSSSLSTAPCPSSLPMARLVSASDLIVVANPDVPVARLKAAMLEKSPDYVEVPLMQLDDPAAHPAGFRIPTYMVALAIFRHLILVR